MSYANISSNKSNKPKLKQLTQEPLEIEPLLSTQIIEESTKKVEIEMKVFSDAAVTEEAINTACIKLKKKIGKFDRLKKVFGKLDKDGTGNLSVKEFRSFLIKVNTSIAADRPLCKVIWDKCISYQKEDLNNELSCETIWNFLSAHANDANTKNAETKELVLDEVRAEVGAPKP